MSTTIASEDSASSRSSSTSLSTSSSSSSLPSPFHSIARLIGLGEIAIQNSDGDTESSESFGDAAVSVYTDSSDTTSSDLELDDSPSITTSSSSPSTISSDYTITVKKLTTSSSGLLSYFHGQHLSQESQQKTGSIRLDQQTLAYCTWLEQENQRLQLQLTQHDLLYTKMENQRVLINNHPEVRKLRASNMERLQKLKISSDRIKELEDQLGMALKIIIDNDSKNSAPDTTASSESFLAISNSPVNLLKHCELPYSWATHHSRLQRMIFQPDESFRQFLFNQSELQRRAYRIANIKAYKYPGLAKHYLFNTDKMWTGGGCEMIQKKQDHPNHQAIREFLIGIGIPESDIRKEVHVQQMCIAKERKRQLKLGWITNK